MSLMQNRIFPSKVFLREKDHRYFHKKTGQEYTSFSRVMHKFKHHFDAEMMAPLSAQKRLREAGISKPTQKQLDGAIQQIKGEWKKKGDDSREWGTDVHKAIETYFKSGVYTPGYEDAIKSVCYILRGYDHSFNEVIFYDDDTLVAGTSDKPCFRTSSKKVIDIFDYKTNTEKGIQYFSTRNQWLKMELAHLEQCNFNEYTLQLSTYAAMAEKWGFRVGRLGIIFIDAVDANLTKLIPVNYLRNEGHAILQSNIGVQNRVTEQEINTEF
jgi:hypothetical protein